MPHIAVARDELGIVSITPIGFPPASGPGTHAIVVVGGVIQFDADEPNAGLRAVLDSTDLASWWLGDVFGEAVAIEAVRLGDAEDSASAEQTLVDAEHGPLFAVATRLMLGLWLRRWWPAPLTGSIEGVEVVIPPIEDWLLDIELATLASDAEQLFVSVSPARILVSRHLTQLASALEALLRHEVAGAAYERVEAVLHRAAATAQDAALADAEGLARLDLAIDNLRAAKAGAAELETDLYSTITAWATEGRDAVVGSLTTWWDTVRPRELAYSAGEDDAEVIASGTTSADWAQVSPRLISSRDDAVRWQLRQTDDGLSVLVTVDAGGPAEATAGFLYGRIELAAETTAVAFDRVGSVFVGSAPIAPDSDTSGMRVTLYSTDTGTPSRHSPSEGHRAELRADVAKRIQKRVETARRQLTEQTFDGVAAIFAFEVLALDPEILRE